MNGNGEPVKLGKSTIDALIESDDFFYRHSRILLGLTSSLKGNFGVDLTFDVLHVGRTNVNYEVACYKIACVVKYEFFVDDGFWDVNVVAEKTLGKYMPRFKPDGPGPNLERKGGTPYPYIPETKYFIFKNPGYK
eukprot:m.20519 g.20519  ORF g.20519 m.20519 type:complete len:135 (+) comp6866_c0_seq1:303-707(+)